MALHLIRIVEADGAQHLDFLIPDRVAVQRYRWVHRHQGQKLEHVVLDHVADDAGGLVITTASLDAHGLGDGDLHMIHIVPIPERLENSVGEAKDEKVLNRFLA